MRTDLGKARLLFWTFFKIGAFTFGGGYAMIPLIQREVAERRRWLKDGDILDIVAIAESTPGPIAINSATFVGYQVCGTFGAFCATLGVVLPSFLVIYVISFVLRQFSQLVVLPLLHRHLHLQIVFSDLCNRVVQRTDRLEHLPAQLQAQKNTHRHAAERAQGADRIQKPQRPARKHLRLLQHKIQPRRPALPRGV